MVEIICKRSGLLFEAENRRKSVHPGISCYTTHKDLDVRYAAIAVIERGKTEGWSTIEQFVEAIEKGEKESEVEESEVECDWDGAWLARITGSHEQYRFDREFVEAVRVEERGKSSSKFYRKFYRLAELPDGFYEGCYKSGKGNETRTYWRIESGVVVKIDLSQVELVYPEIYKSESKSVSVFESFTVGEIVERSGQWYKVAEVLTRHYNEDGQEVDAGDTEICSTRYQSILHPVSLAQIAQWYRDGYNVGDAAILAANQAGRLSLSEAMNSDF
jgi:hypothetical protein